jgi:O-antigen/teichoic acid export membrane protein
MSRTRRFVSSLGSGYLAMAANTIYSAASIPLALHYLTREEFGLWAVVTQIAGYLTLLDFGVGQSVARILVDYKDDMNSGDYGSVLKTASIGFGLQAVGILLTGAFVGNILADLLQIPSNLHSGFQILLLLQCAVLGGHYALTPLWVPLWSHQRSDVVNYASIAVFGANGIALWIGFELGLKYYSLVLASFAGVLVQDGITTFATINLGLLPGRGKWGRITKAKFWEIFNFSRDLFILQVANQLISASQVVLVSRLMGLEAAAVWSICTKSFTLAQQMIVKIFDFSAPGFSEMLVRAEILRFKERFPAVLSLTAAGAGFFGVLGALGNRMLISYWTQGKISWDSWTDVCAGAYLFVWCITHCYAGFPGLMKQIKGYKYIILVEGGCVVFGSILLAPVFGFPGVFVPAIIGNLFCSGLYGAYRVSEHFRMSIFDVTLAWIGPALRYVFVFALCGSAIFWLGAGFEGSTSFLAKAVAAGTVGIVLALIVGVTSGMRGELRAVALNIIRKWRHRDENGRPGAQNPLSL